MSNIFYELQRTFRSKFVIAMIAMIMLISALIAYIITTQNPSSPAASISRDPSGLFSIVNGIFGIVIPILAVFMGYLTYGKDRTSGVLESVITRPVTKGELMFSRFIANMAAILIAVVASAFIFDAGVFILTGNGLTSNMIYALIWTYLVEGAGFVGLVYLCSHLTRSQTAVLGISIALFLILDLLWSTITTVILFEVFHKGLATLSSLQGTVIADFLSPSGYEANVLLYLTRSFTGLASGFTPHVYTINPASYGITLASLAVIGAAWIVLPVLFSYLLARKYD